MADKIKTPETMLEDLVGEIREGKVKKAFVVCQDEDGQLTAYSVGMNNGETVWACEWIKHKVMFDDDAEG